MLVEGVAAETLEEAVCDLRISFHEHAENRIKGKVMATKKEILSRGMSEEGNAIRVFMATFPCTRYQLEYA